MKKIYVIIFRNKYFINFNSDINFILFIVFKKDINISKYINNGLTIKIKINIYTFIVKI